MSRAPTLLHVFPTFAVGGAQIRFAALANHFGKAFRHAIIAMDGRYDCRDRLDSSLDLYFPQVDLRKRDTLGNMLRFRGMLHDVAPSRLVTYNWGSIECAMANWPRLTHHIHIEDGFGADEAVGQLRRRVWTRRAVLRRSTVVLPSRQLYKLATAVWKLPADIVRYIPNGIDCKRFAGPVARGMSWPGEGPVIGTVAALREEKNLLRLLEAFSLARKQLPCRLVIAGDGPMRQALEAQAAAIGLSSCVFFTGYIAAPERVYPGLDIFALSSDTEQMPTAVIEAMAAGLPIAATNVGDIAQMVSDDNRPYLSPRNSEALARALLGLLRDQELRRTLGCANRRMAMVAFDQTKMFEAYGALF